MSTLSIAGVAKTFGHKQGALHVLHDVNLEMTAGQFVSLIGPSGCGKSTLLRIVAGFERYDEGTVRLDQTDIRGPSVDRGMMFQQPMLFPWLTALDNVLYGPRRHGRLTRAKRMDARTMLERVGLSGFEDSYPHELSGGMQHRVALARALINRPQILLMDEPFGALDAITRAHMQEFLLSLWQETSLTILFVTHDVEEATLLSDRVCVMSKTPATIKYEIPVDITRPRHYDDIESTGFVETKRQLRELLG